DKNHIPHRLIEFESEQGQAWSKRLHLTTRDLPNLITPAGAPLRRPSLREVAQVAGLLRPLAFENENEIEADLAIVGAGPAGLAAEGREKFEGVGVYYAATALEGQICRNEIVIVAGSGNSAGQAAMFLSEGAAKVLLVIRGKDLSKMSTYLSRRVPAKNNIEILYHTQIRKLFGNKTLEEAELENIKTGEHTVVRTPAIFSMIGAVPCTEWLPPEI